MDGGREVVEDGMDCFTSVDGEQNGTELEGGNVGSTAYGEGRAGEQSGELAGGVAGKGQVAHLAGGGGLQRFATAAWHDSCVD